MNFWLILLLIYLVFGALLSIVYLNLKTYYAWPKRLAMAFLMGFIPPFNIQFLTGMFWLIYIIVKGD